MTKPVNAADTGRSASGACQMSRFNLFDQGARPSGRRSAHHQRRGRVLPDRSQFARRWSLLMITSFSSREECAVCFGVTYQTACNWFDARSRPYGDAVDFAVHQLPKYHDVMGG